MIRVVRVLLRLSGGAMLSVTAMSVIAGLSTAALLGHITSRFSAGATTPQGGAREVGQFIFLSVGTLGFGLASQLLLRRLTTSVVASLRLRLTSHFMGLPLRELETLGPSRVQAALTEDVAVLVEGLSTVPSAASNLAVVGGCFGYLIWLTPPGFAIWAGITVFGLLTARFIHEAAKRYMRLTRLEIDTLFRHYGVLVGGAKELRLHSARKKAFTEDGLKASILRLQNFGLTTYRLTSISGVWARSLVFLTLGIVMYARLPWFTTSTLAAFVVVILYVTGPAEALLSFGPTLDRVDIALKRLNEFGLTEVTTSAPEVHAEPSALVEEIELIEVSHRYFNERQNAEFKLGPIDLTLRAGKVTFIVGGNGSGKSTLVKVLTGLYPPMSGEVTLNGRSVVDSNRQWYRDHFSAVFADFHLFDRLWGSKVATLDADAARYLAELQLDHKVTLRDGAFSTTELSQGQRKRLALLTAFLDDRPVYVFDEWASDQDPIFRRVFYRVIIPDLKAKGKIVVVVSHDDQFFDVADELVKLQDGRRMDVLTNVFMSRLRGENSRPPPPPDAAPDQGRHRR